MAEEKPLAGGNLPRDQDESKPLRVRRGRVESVDLYEIKDNELELFEKGSPADLQLNFSIFLFSTAFSGICTLFTATFQNRTIETIFLLVTIVGIVFGGYLIVAWRRNRTSLKDTCKRIRERIPPDLIEMEKQNGASLKPAVDELPPKG